MRHSDCNLRIIFSLSFFIVMLGSCSHETKKVSAYDEFYQLDNPPDAKIEDVFSDVELIPLENEGNFYPAGVEKLDIIDGYYKITDNKQFMLLFKKDGKFVSSSEEKFGPGPEEFSTPMGYSFNPHSKLVEVFTPAKIMFYDTVFNYVKECPLPTQPGKKSQFYSYSYDLSDHRHILVPSPSSDSPNSLILYDSSDASDTPLYSYDEDVVINTTFPPKCFHELEGGRILFTPPALANTVYELDRKNLTFKKTIGFCFGDKEMSAKDIEPYRDNRDKLMKYMLTNERLVPMRVLPSDNKLVIIHKTGNSIDRMKTVVVDRKTGESRQLAMYKDRKNVFPLIEAVDNEYAYAIAEKETLEVFPELLLNKTAGDALSGIEDESLVILRYKLK